MVALRLGNLTDAERAVLELVAVGEPLGQAELARLADPGSVETLERKGLITSLADGRRVQLRLAHPVIGDVVRAGVSALRERALTRSLAEVIETTGARRREDTLRLASLRLAGGGGSASLLQAGAIAARGRHDHSLAEQLARAALAEGAGFGARFVAAEAAQFQGRPAQAERELAALAADAASDAERARVALLRFDNAFLLHGRVPDLRLLDDVAGAIADPFWRDQLLNRRSFVMSFSRGPRAVVETAWLGRLDEVTRLLSAHPTSGVIPAPDEPWVLWSLFNVRVTALIWAGRLREAEELLTRAQGVVIDQPAAEASAFVAERLASLHLEQGRLMSAFRRAGESYTLFQQLGRAFAAQLPYTDAAQALALAGQAGRAAGTLAALDALGIPAVLINETEVLQARAWTAAAAGDLPAARQQLEAAADLGEEIGDLIGAVSALHGLARLGHARQVSARLAALATQVDGDLVAARAAYASAVAARDR